MKKARKSKRISSAAESQDLAQLDVIHYMHIVLELPSTFTDAGTSNDSSTLRSLLAILSNGRLP